MSAEQQNQSQKDLETFPSVVERKHVIKRYRREIGGHEFWVAEVWPPKRPRAAVSVMHRTDSDSLHAVTNEAKRYVGVLIRNGGNIPAEERGADITFDATQGLDVFNVRSNSGKPQWCERHWKAVADGAMAGTHNAVAAGMYLTSVFVEKIQQDGFLQRQNPRDPYVMEILRDSYSPFCCWLGEEIVGRIMEASTVEALEKSGALREIEKQLRRK